MEQQELIDCLNKWGKLNSPANLSTWDEETIRNLINYEVSTKNRSSIVTRLHQRYVKLLTARQRDGLSKGVLL